MARAHLVVALVLCGASPLAAQPSASAATLKLVVRDARGPVAGAEVSLRASTVHTDAGGRVTVQISDRDDVTIRAPGSATTTLRIEPAPASTVERRVTLRPGARLAGTLVDADGRALADQQLHLQVSGDRYAPSATTDASGRWAFDAIGAGHHVATFWADGCARSEQVVETDGVTPRSVALRCDRGAAIAGRVVDSKGAAVAGARVEYDGNVELSDARGGFRATGLATGEHTIWAQSGGRASPIRTLQLAKDEQLRVVLVVVESTISGRVTSETGKAVAKASVVAEVISVHTETDANGRYTIVIPPGTHRLVARSGRAVSPARVARSGERAADLVVNPRGSVTGRVRARGAPVADFGIGLVGYISQPVHATDGRFALELGTGASELVLVATGFAPRVVAVTVAELATVVDVGEIELDVGREVRGRVVDERGRGVANAIVAASLDGDFITEAPLDALRHGHLETRTDRTGAFAIRGIDPKGRVRIEARAGDLRASRRELAAATATVTLALHATGSLVGAIAQLPSYGDRRVFVLSDSERDVVYETSLTLGGDFTLEGLPAGDYMVAVQSAQTRRVTIVAGRRTELSP